MNPLCLILGNLCSLAAMFTDSLSAVQQNAKSVLAVQNISQLFYCIGSILLQGYSGAVQNAVSILRNLAAIYDFGNAFLEWFLIGLGVVLGIAFNNVGIMGWLPIIAGTQYSIAIFRFRDNARALKISLFISAIMFVVFSAVILNIVGVATNAVVAATTLISLVKKSAEGEDL